MNINIPGRGDCLPRSDHCGDLFQVLEDAVPVIDRSEWEDRFQQLPDLALLVRKIKNQGQEGSCASNATVQAYEIVLNQQFGLRQWVEFSAMSLYKRVGRTAGGGSMISDNLQQLSQKGILPLTTDANQRRFPHTHPATGFGRSLPSGWEATARKFRAPEWFDIRSFDGFMSALLLGFPVVYGRAGHAICGVRGERRDGQWRVKYANSWGAQWGDHGFGYDSESFISGAISSYGAFAVRAVAVQSDFLEAA
ncbi:C1 family peptidase [Lignipirellula cremea]|uniref:Papain family cysteine protease n=1 Tax=Lignipirellula cremea TaxID=2528010 RepID=A0A518E0B6_9BACT|nr:C1 family peptidase [Lignipirellula cremea]QDU97540.1 Papain family cysteine protease [Lignipirellula cremea]